MGIFQCHEMKGIGWDLKILEFSYALADAAVVILDIDLGERLRLKSDLDGSAVATAGIYFHSFLFGREFSSELGSLVLRVEFHAVVPETAYISFLPLKSSSNTNLRDIDWQPEKSQIDSNVRRIGSCRTYFAGSTDLTSKSRKVLTYN